MLNVLIDLTDTDHCIGLESSSPSRLTVNLELSGL